MWVFVAKQVVIMSHWGSVGVIVRSVGLTGVQWGSVRLGGGSVGVIGAQWGSVGVSGDQWGSMGFSGAQCAVYIHPLIKNKYYFNNKLF